MLKIVKQTIIYTGKHSQRVSISGVDVINKIYERRLGGYWTGVDVLLSLCLINCQELMMFCQAMYAAGATDATGFI